MQTISALAVQSVPCTAVVDSTLKTSTTSPVRRFAIAHALDFVAVQREAAQMLAYFLRAQKQFMSVFGRFCCKSLFGLSNKNS
jgi:hypothetical protein